jgi:hypothetical protein
MTNLSADQLDQIQGGNIANMFGFLPDLIRYVQQTGVVQAYLASFGATPNAGQYNAMGDYGN